jgi:hypothetical protein
MDGPGHAEVPLAMGIVIAMEARCLFSFPLAGEGQGGGCHGGTADVDPHLRPLKASFARLDPRKGEGS